MGAILALAVTAMVEARADMQAAPQGSRATSAQGDLIAFDHEGYVFTMWSDGTNQRQLFDAGRFNGPSPAISPDGTRIAFAADVTGGFSATREIYVMNVDGTNVTRLTNNNSDDAEPSWSPDGTRIAFTSNRAADFGGIYSMKADGTEQTRLTPLRGAGSPIVERSPAWSPDGNAIAFARFNRNLPDAGLFVLPASGGAGVRITDAAAAGGQDQRPRWSPDGTEIVFTRAAEELHVCVVNANGTGFRQLTGSTGARINRDPVFSPDGTQIAYISSGSSAGTDLDVWVMDADGSDPVQLTDTDTEAELGPDWRRSSEGGPKLGAPLWLAGRDFAANEKPDRPAEATARNETVPEWIYGYRSAANSVDFFQFGPDQHVNATFDERIEGFAIDGSGPAVVVNTGRRTNFGSGDNLPLLPRQIVMNPASDGRVAVVRWTAPFDGRYHIIARWLDLERSGGNGVSCHIVRNGVSLFTQEIDNGGAADSPLVALDLQLGESIDFVVGARGDATSDATGFNAVLSVAPSVVINSPGVDGSGKMTVTEGTNLSVSGSVRFGHQVRTVELRDNNKVIARDETAPYEFTINNISSGTHRLLLVATDARGVEGASEPIDVTVTKNAATAAQPAGSSRRTATSVGADDAAQTKAAAGGTSYFFLKSSGLWQDPASWTPEGVPGPQDDAFILGPDGKGAVVFLFGGAEVNTLTVGSGSVIADSLPPPAESNILVRREAFLNDAKLSRFTLVIDQPATLTIFSDCELEEMAVSINGQFSYSGPGEVAAGSTRIQNNGTITLVRPPATRAKSKVNLQEITNHGKLVAASTTSLSASTLVSLGNIRLISDGGAGLISDGGAGLVSDNGSALIGDRGGSVVGNHTVGLVGDNGSALVGPDGASLVGMDGASLVGDNGSASASSLSAKDTGVEQPAATTSNLGTILLRGGSVNGTGNLLGNVVNEGAFLSVGASIGALHIAGDYTQQSGGTLVLEVAGTSTDPLQYDHLDVAGAANLDGKLIVRSLSDVAPQFENVVPLTYASVSGSFSSISANAQVSLGANGMTMNVAGPNPPAPKALNIATRMRVETSDNVLIAGFIVTGSQPKKVLIRGIGPSLPVSGALPDTTLDLDGGTFFNDDWKSNQEQEIRDTTIPPSSELESAIVAVLEPGAHTAVLRGKGDTTGIGLVEVYDLESGTPAQLANIATRGLVLTGDDVMIGGFIIGGDYPARVLIRAIGPSLPVDGKLQDPVLQLVDSNGSTITNDDWRTTQEAEIVATTIPPTNEKEAAIVATLVPGAYTAIVRGKDDTVGIALVEGYTLP
jgi:Tol biopolymer transport system component